MKPVEHKKGLTYREKRAKMEAWLHSADELLEEYGNELEPEPPDAA